MGGNRNMGLKPCPFCGSKNLSITAPSNHGGWDGPPSYIIQCKNCFAEIDLKSSCKKGTLIKWNRRYEPPNSPLTLDELREMDGEPVWLKLNYGMAFAAEWAIVCTALERIAGNSLLLHFEKYGKAGTAYRRRPEEEHYETN